MQKAMIITVGTGETVSHGICCSIKQQNPEYIVFVLTRESKDKTLPLILKDEIMQERKYGEIVLSDENDVQEIRSECIKTINKIEKSGYSVRNIVTDYTSGTKAMSVGLILSAIDKKVGTLVYVSGERDKNGRVISGTEKPIPIEPNKIYADLLLERTITLFNTHQFNSCLEIIEQIKNIIGNHPEYQDKLALLEQLSQAYSSWDIFDLEKAFNILKEITGNPLLSNLGIKNKVEQNKQILYKEKEEVFCIERIVDLLENARRRGEIEKKYDDAVARLYRLFEYISQYLIFQRGLYPKNEKGNIQTDDIILNELSEDLQKKYAIYKKENGKVQPGLVGNYEFLSDLKDEIGKSFIEEYGRKDGLLKKITSCRNNSILAHGFWPVGEECFKDFLGVCENYVKKLFRDNPDGLNEIRKRCQFPTLNV